MGHAFYGLQLRLGENSTDMKKYGGIKKSGRSHFLKQCIYCYACQGRGGR